MSVIASLEDTRKSAAGHRISAPTGQKPTARRVLAGTTRNHKELMMADKPQLDRQMTGLGDLKAAVNLHGMTATAIDVHVRSTRNTTPRIARDLGACEGGGAGPLSWGYQGSIHAYPQPSNSIFAVGIRKHWTMRAGRRRAFSPSRWRAAPGLLRGAGRPRRPAVGGQASAGQRAPPCAAGAPAPAPASAPLDDAVRLVRGRASNG